MSAPRVIHGDCLDVLRTLPDASVDAVCTDPPYGLEFMGKEWDGANGFRRSLNPADVERNNPFGRTSRTSPEYRAGQTFGLWCLAWAEECLRVLKPGGHLLAFGGTRTWHRLACAIEDAGFEVRDSIAWLYGSGFPKSLDVSKAIDKLDATDARRARNLRFTEWLRSTGVTSSQIDAATSSFMGGHYLTAREQAAVPTAAMFDLIRPLLSVEVPEWVEALVLERTVESENFKARTVIGERKQRANGPDSQVAMNASTGVVELVTAPATDAARTWQGWGTALKPAHEPIVVARKPLAGTVAANVLAHGTGALNVDGCRIAASDPEQYARNVEPWTKWERGGSVLEESKGLHTPGRVAPRTDTTAGRWPANVVLDGHREPVLRLRYNLPTEVERTIRESFGASTDHLPAVRDQRHGAAEQGDPSEVLLPRLPGSVDVGEPDGREGAEVAQAAHARVDRQDEGERKHPEGAGESALEGRDVPVAGVRDGSGVGAVPRGSGALLLDGASEPIARELRARASARGGSDAGSAPALDGACASPERREGRQSPGEPRGPLGGGASSDARRGGPRVVALAEGERGATGSPLEVLRSECPPGWWHYFDVVAYRPSQAEALDEQSGERPGFSGGGTKGAGFRAEYVNGERRDTDLPATTFDDLGGASRFFYIAREDNESCIEEMTAHSTSGATDADGEKRSMTARTLEAGESGTNTSTTLPIDQLDKRFAYIAKADASERVRVNGTAHPTVKPLALMRWLVRLVTPPGGTVLEPFAGSGTTVEACILEGFDCIAIEREADYLPLIQQRIDRRRDPVQAVKTSGEDGGLFDLLGEV